MYLNQGQLSSGGNKLLPETTNLTSWLTTPTTDGKTVSNIQGTDANLTGINCIQFTSGGAADYIDLEDTITTTSAWELECDIMWTNFGSANSGVAFLSSDDSSKEFIRINGADGDNLFFEGKLGGTQFREYALTFSLALNTAYRLKVAVNGTAITLSINGVAQQVITWGNNANSNVFGSIGRPIAVQGTAKLANWKLSSGGVVLAHLPIQEGSGTKCFDISGKGNHGTIANSTWTTADGFVSHNTLHGFTTDSSVKVPALDNKTLQTVTLDGANDYIDIPEYTIVDGDVIDMRFRVITNALNTADGSGGIRVIFGGARDADTDGQNDYFAIYDGADADSVEVDPPSSGATGRQIFRHVDYNVGGDDTNESADKDKQIQIGDGVIDVKLVVSGSNVTSTIDGAESQTEAGEFVGFNIRRISGGKGKRYLNAEWHSFKITNSSGVVQRNYEFQSYGTTIVDSVSSSNNGTLVNATLTNAYKTRVIDSSGLLVSADYENNNTTIGNPSGFVHNQSEVGFDLVSVDKTSANILGVDNSNEDDDFAKDDSNGNVIQYLQYSTGISGTSLTRTRAYVG